MTWLARVASLASLAAGFAQALSYLWPEAQSGWLRASAITLPLLVLTALNVVGVRFGVGTALFLLGGKLLPLLIFLGAGLFVATRERLLLQSEGTGGAGEAALLLLFAYAGFENTPAAAGEYRNPRRDVPIALLINIAFVTLLYVAVQWVTLGTLADAASSRTPLADAAGMFLGSWAGLLLTAGAALSILGTNSNTVFAGPRYLLALARDGYGPRFVSRIHPRFRTPAAAVTLQTAIALPLALSGTFFALAELSVVARLASYMGTAAAVPVLRRKLAGMKPTIRLPGGPWIPVAAGLLSVGLAASATRSNLLAAAIALVVGIALFLLRRRPEAA